MSMKRPLVELTYYESYYFANVVKNILEHQEPYLRNLDGFYGDGRHLSLVVPFRRYSVLHSFIKFIIDGVMTEDSDEVEFEERQMLMGSSFGRDYVALPVNRALERYEIPHEGFEEWLDRYGVSFVDASAADVEEYYDELRMNGVWGRLLDRATREVFFVLFQNRRALLLFNQMIADSVSQTDGDEVDRVFFERYFARDGVLKRARIPQWARRAVFFRDRGMCVFCKKDLIWSNKHFDHIVPLASGGLNDVVNIQLLCDVCNLAKRDGEPATSTLYEAWYADE